MPRPLSSLGARHPADVWSHEGRQALPRLGISLSLPCFVLPLSPPLPLCLTPCNSVLLTGTRCFASCWPVPRDRRGVFIVLSMDLVFQSRQIFLPLDLVDVLFPPLLCGGELRFSSVPFRETDSEGSETSSEVTLRVVRVIPLP